MAYTRTFRTKSGKTVTIKVKGHKKEPRHYLTGGAEPPKKGTCKTVKMRGGCTQSLCFDGRGVTGWTFRKGTRKCGR